MQVNWVPIRYTAIQWERKRLGVKINRANKLLADPQKLRGTPLLGRLSTALGYIKEIREWDCIFQASGDSLLR